MKLCIFFVLLCACSIAVNAEDIRIPHPSTNFARKVTAQRTNLYEQVREFVESLVEEALTYLQSIAIESKNVGDKVDVTAQRKSLYEQVREFVESLVEEALTYVQSIAIESKNVGDKVETDLTRSVGTVENQIEYVLKLAEDRLENLTGQRELPAPCANNYRAALLKVVAIARVTMQSCLTVALQHAKSLAEEIRPLVAEIVKLASELQNLAEDCWNSSANIADAIICVFSKGLEITNKILRIATNLKNLVAIAKQKAAAIVQETLLYVVVYIDQTVANARQKIEEIGKKVEQCIAEGQ